MSEQVMQIATRIRELRETMDMSPVELAGELNVSTQEYLDCESGATDIPISLVVSLSHFAKIDMMEILTGGTPRMNIFSVTRHGKGVDIDRASQYSYKNLAYNFLHRKIEPLLVTVPPGTNEDLHTNSHPGQEFDYILEGAMRLMINGNEIILNPGDSVFYNSRYPHAMQCAGEIPVVFLAMVIP